MVRLRVGHQRSQFWPILACIVDYHSQFWGPETIFMVHETYGALTCRSSTQAVLAYFGPFHGVQERFPRLMNTGVRLRVGHQHSQFWPIWPLSWTITHCFGVSERFSWLMNPRVRFRIGHQHSQFWPILAHFMDYYSPFFGPGVISMVVEIGRASCRGRV